VSDKGSDFLMTGKYSDIEQWSSDPEDLDDYYESTKLEARFDPMTIQLLVVEAIQKHQAYGMLFEDYIKQRKKFMSYDETEKKRLSFYLPLFPAMMSADYATDFRISYNQFLVFMIELGLITFLYDYHDQYDTVKEGKKTLSKMVTSERNRIYYLQMDKQTICIGSCAGSRIGKVKHFTPNVPEWLYNAITDSATYINMSVSDFIYLCWCIGVQSSLTEDKVNPVLSGDNSAILSTFNHEFDIYAGQIDHTMTSMKTDTYNNQ
jgi:hypothetical protein